MIVLQILKIIGIVLACIIGFIILLLLLILFTPLTYKIQAEGENADIKGSAIARMLGIFAFRLNYADKKADYKATIAGIPVYKGGFGKDEAEAVKEVIEEETQPKEPTPEIKSEKETVKAEAKAEKPQAKAEKTLIIEEKKAAEEEKEPEPEDASDEEKPGKLEKLKEKVRGIIDKIRSIYDKYQKAKYILEAPVTKRAWQFIKARLIDLLNHIRPRSVKGHIDFGFDDPATTAEVYGVAGSVACLIDDRLIVAPDFDKKGIDLDVEIKGRIFVGYVLLLFLKVWRNKDLKRVRNYIRRNF